MTTQNSIVRGPSKYELSVAFFDLIGGHRRPIKFTVGGLDFETTVELEIVVNTISWEDGSGNSWCFGGYVSSEGPLHCLRVVGYFNTNKRDGWIKNKD